jgi:CheY-like chemotaxis protein/HPt (histidine-containing phosphotransfer) domain-containing protein
MGGRIWVDSEVGRGSTFHFTARMVQRAGSSATAPQLAHEVSRPAPPAESRQPLRILVAEDNPHNCKVVGQMLGKDRHDVTIVHSGREAVAAWERERFDLVLMDVQMPEMDGLQATAAIRAAEAGTGRHVPIIAMTAYARKEDRDRCLAAGMDGYVSKPVNAENLRRAIDEGRDTEVRPADGPLPREAPCVCDQGACVWDQDAALARVDGDRPFLRQMASLLLEQLPPRIESIRQAVEAHELSRIGPPAHTLKNDLGNFVANRAADLVQELETCAHQGDVAGARTAFDALEHEVLRLVPQLEQFATAHDTSTHLAHSA